MPAIAGTSRLRSCCLPCKMTPPATRNSSGRAKLKKAALGLRQNMCRSSRYWRQVRATASGIRCQLQVDVLQAGPSHVQLVQALPSCQGIGGELVQGARRVVGLHLHVLAGGGAVSDGVMSRAHSKLAWRADCQHASVLDDRYTVGQCLRLVQIVGREEDRLAKRAQRADRLPGGAPRLRIETGGRLVEEDQLGVADERQSEVEPAQLAAGKLARAHVGLLLQAHQAKYLLDVAGVRVEAGPVAQRLARCQVAVDAAALQHDPDALAQCELARGGIVAEHRNLPRAARAVALPDLDRPRR